MESTPVRNLSKRALIPLLPTLKASDAGALTEARRDRLLRLLAISPNDSGYRDLTELFSRSAYRREIELRVSILKAFEQVGGAKELPAVLRLSQGKPFTLHSRASIPKEVQQAAQECLPYLQAPRKRPARKRAAFAGVQRAGYGNRHSAASGKFAIRRPARTTVTRKRGRHFVNTVSIRPHGIVHGSRGVFRASYTL